MLNKESVATTASSVLTVSVPWLGTVFNLICSQLPLETSSGIEEYGPPNKIAIFLNSSTLSFNSSKIESI